MKDYSIEQHLTSIETFMTKAGQCIGLLPRVPSSEERLLRAKLIYEECMETIEALGVDHIFGKFIDAGEEHYNPLEVLDGVCDISVVSCGTLLTCGLDSVFAEALRRVDENNMEKLGEGSQIREDGKILKPKGFKPVDLTDLI